MNHNIVNKKLSATTQVRLNGALFIATAGCAPVTKKATPQIALNRSCDIASVLHHVQPPLSFICPRLCSSYVCKHFSQNCGDNYG